MLIEENAISELVDRGGVEPALAVSLVGCIFREAADAIEGSYVDVRKMVDRETIQRAIGTLADTKGLGSEMPRVKQAVVDGVLVRGKMSSILGNRPDEPVMRTGINTRIGRVM